MIEDLRWFGLEWQEGPDCGGPFRPYNQSERQDNYQKAFEQLRVGGFVYPCYCSRRDVLRALRAPHSGEEEPIYPGTCRPQDSLVPGSNAQSNIRSWRFRVPDGEKISFLDGHFGLQQFEAGKDFGDFVVWRQKDGPSYQLAVVVDDSAMQISEVVRGEDLLLSTVRQLLIYRALNLPIPVFHHCSLVTDHAGKRLAKRHDALSLRELRLRGFTPEELRKPGACVDRHLHPK
jgi:glutamyl-tRNA synthetase